MKKKKMVAALTAAVLICTSGCSLGGTGEKNKNRSKNTFVNTHAYFEARLKQGLTAETRVLRHLRYLTRQNISPIFFVLTKNVCFHSFTKG